MFEIETILLNADETFAVTGAMRGICIHHTAGWHNPANTVRDWENDKRGRIGTSLVIGGQSVLGNDNSQDGRVVRAIQRGRNAYHLGVGSQTSQGRILGIEVCAFGGLKEGKTWSGAKVVEEQIEHLSAPFRGFKQFHKYSDVQLAALKSSILTLSNQTGIDVREGLVALIKKHGLQAFDKSLMTGTTLPKGLFSHSNVRRDKSDMYPCDRLADMLLSL